MRRGRFLPGLLRQAPVALFAAVLLAFALLTPKFLTAANLGNVVVQSASTAVVAVGMTFVLLTGGVDLSVGAVMFVAIAAAVLGGTSLFGGRGRVFPGTAIGALLTQSVENGLTLLNADPYLYPLVLSGIIFLAVAVDGARSALLERLGRRPIRREEEPGAPPPEAPLPRGLCYSGPP